MARESKQIIFNCDHCKKETSQFQSQYNKSKKHFCSKECSSSYKHGENNPAYNSHKINCTYCNSELIINNYQLQQRDNHFCNQECFGKWHSSQKLGKTKVEKFEYSCDNCNETLLLSQKQLNRSKHHYCNRTCKKVGEIKLGIFKGKNNGRYDDGKTPIRRLIRSSLNYLTWRANVYKKDNWTCVKCSTKGKHIHAHHIYPFFKIIKEFKIETVEESEQCLALWNIDNGITLCKECHKKEHEARKENL